MWDKCDLIGVIWIELMNNDGNTMVEFCGSILCSINAATTTLDSLVVMGDIFWNFVQVLVLGQRLIFPIELALKADKANL